MINEYKLEKYRSKLWVINSLLIPFAFINFVLSIIGVVGILLGQSESVALSINLIFYFIFASLTLKSYLLPFQSSNFNKPKLWLIGSVVILLWALGCFVISFVQFHICYANEYLGKDFTEVSIFLIFGILVGFSSFYSFLTYKNTKNR
jgi:hypothetical protein